MLVAEGIVASYVDEIDILHGVSLDVMAGRIVSIIGPNGSGKSTLVRVICGMLTPKRGQVRHGDRVLSGQPAHRKAELGIASVLLMVIADETDEAALAKWRHYQGGIDLEALVWLGGQAGADKTSHDQRGSAQQMSAVTEQAVNMNIGVLIGSYASVAGMLDGYADVPGTKGLMLTFDDFLVGMEQFGQRIQPPMRTCAGLANVAA